MQNQTTQQYISLSIRLLSKVISNWYEAILRVCDVSFMTEKILTCSICWQFTDAPICKLIMVVITVRRVSWCGYLNCWFQHCLVIFSIVKRPFKHHLASNASICDGGCLIGSLMSNELVGFHPRSKPEINDEFFFHCSHEVLETNHQVDNKDYSQPWYKDPYQTQQQKKAKFLGWLSVPIPRISDLQLTTSRGWKGHELNHLV